jgi:hypothetical protein
MSENDMRVHRYQLRLRLLARFGAMDYERPGIKPRTSSAGVNTSPGRIAGVVNEPS